MGVLVEDLLALARLDEMPQTQREPLDLEPLVRVAKLDTESAPQIAQRFNIRSIPTLILFKDGREAARQSGAMGRADIVRWTRAHLTGADAGSARG